jgi:hypothetical protein
MRRLSSLPVACAILVVVSVVTHLLSFPGTLPYFKEVTAGQTILDMRPSFSADAVYGRLTAMGGTGRDAYLRLIYTVDVVFPLALLMFLTAWRRFFVPKSRVLSALPWIAFGADLVENLLVLVMLLAWPTPIAAAAGAIALFTVTKRSAMIAAALLPPFTAAIRRFRR